LEYEKESDIDEREEFVFLKWSWSIFWSEWVKISKLSAMMKKNIPVCVSAECYSIKVYSSQQYFCEKKQVLIVVKKGSQSIYRVGAPICRAILIFQFGANVKLLNDQRLVLLQPLELLFTDPLQ
jgi:hypothetical protein